MQVKPGFLELFRAAQVEAVQGGVVRHLPAVVPVELTLVAGEVALVLVIVPHQVMRAATAALA